VGARVMRGCWPLLKCFGTVVCEPDGEFEGYALQIRLGAVMVELTLARRSRTVVCDNA